MHLLANAQRTNGRLLQNLASVWLLGVVATPGRWYVRSMPNENVGVLVGGRYRIGSQVAQGGMGTVFRGLDTRSGEPVAIKLLNPESVLADPQSLERFAREGELLGRLEHPSIVKFLDALEDGQQRYLVMEWVSGGSLAELIASGGALPIDRVLGIALDLCDALTRSHRLGIIHRDIKPANVLIASDGTPKLTDFGVAHLVGQKSLTLPNAIVGTLDYLSPEVLRAERVDARADVWAFGVLLFELLTLVRPFASAHVAQTLHAIVYDAPPDLESLRPDCPAALVDLVYRMLEKQAQQRISSMRRVGAELENVLIGSETDERATLAHASTLGARAWHGALSDVPPLRNLPAELTPFIGRGAELAKLARLLSDKTSRLITILAPGGMGKSRLALEVCRQVAAGIGAFEQTQKSVPDFAAGVAFVALARLDSAEFVPFAIAEAVGLELERGMSPLEQLLAHLRDRNMLLVLDNFEHLLEGVAIVGEILHAAPRVFVLATSRERLGLSGETSFELSSMLVPEEHASSIEQPSTAVQLFVTLAQRVKPDFELTTETVEPVARVCRLVGGMPLGIVLSASWLSVLSPGEIADEIERNLDFLATEMRDVPERQRSLRAAFDYSWNRLDEPSRNVFSALCVFRGGFTRAAAEVVAGANVRALALLTSKSLIHRHLHGGRYEIHEVLRQYAEENLAATPARHERALDLHEGYYAAFLAQRGEGSTEAPVVALDEIETEMDNVHAAWKRMLARGRLEHIASALAGLEAYFWRRGTFVEGELMFAAAARALSTPPATPSAEQARLLGLSLGLQSAQCQARGSFHEAVELGRRALRALDGGVHAKERADLLIDMGRCFQHLGDRKQGVELIQQALELCRSAGDMDGASWALISLGKIQAWHGAYMSAEAPLLESIALQERVASSSAQLLHGLVALGLVRVGRGDFEEGCRLLLRALQMNDEIGNTWGSLGGQEYLAIARRSLGDYAEAERLARSCLSLSRDRRADHSEFWSLVILGDTLRDQDRFAEAGGCLEQAGRLARRVDDPLEAAVLNLKSGELALLQGEHAAAVARLSLALDWFEPHQVVWGTVQALSGLGYAACDAGDFREARERFAQALQAALAHGAQPLANGAAAGIAHWLKATGKLEFSVEVLARVQRDPATERGTLRQRVEPLLAELRDELDPEVCSRALERGSALDLGALAHSLVEDDQARGA